MKKYDFLILGGGIFGLCTAIELRKQNYTVGLLNPDQIPHPLAASTDISKIVRMEYGTDIEYMDMAIESLEQWRLWNEVLGETIFHETGFLLTSSSSIDDNSQSFEGASFLNLKTKGFTPERLSSRQIEKRFPVFKSAEFIDGFYHAKGGYAESGRAVSLLTDHARKLGVKIHENQTAQTLEPNNGQIEKIQTKEGSKFYGREIIVCAGNFTHYLVPDLQPFFKVTGHPVFHIKPSNPEIYKSPNLTVFAADISNTGWYGFPLHPREGLVKIANHSAGLELHPAYDERIVNELDKENLKSFLKKHLPSLVNDPIVYTRRCCYTDTLDGHFWIDRHPVIENLSIGSGGSGHGFKMGPVVGKMIAAIAQRKTHKWSSRYNWRTLHPNTIAQEEARNNN